MEMPTSMRAAIVREPGGPEVLEIGTVPAPRPGPGQVLIRVEAAGVNAPDAMQRKGLYPPPPDASPLLGLEVAGEIVAVGGAPEGTEGAHALALGDRVCALTNGGGYAEFCAVPAGQCLPWPEGYDAVRAAALPETYFTVWSNLFEENVARAGSSLLVHGGTSGIGSTAIQLASRRGITVFATAGTAEKCATSVRLGATAAINYREEDFAARIAELTQKRGVDVILDMIGGRYLDPNLRSLATDGRLVIIALQGGAKAPDADLARIMTRRLHVTGTTLRPRPASFKARIAASLRREAWPLLERGEIAPLIHAALPFTEVAEAHSLLDSGSHAGKIVLRF
ncbi:NAD(P)H-quinone oxidoreductase [Rhizosaccharibacter radicis]|uniref:NAD(P)H-quinone oxidoreductase n=1 Tax=Rhizosaccharibacter radicis TaxID=2782605 RepID=A0ABT1VX09_9PROT|nr:NAD(P)H-quinone oxidoreductase [Acetobacteraceae bacterium KSS12]